MLPMSSKCAAIKRGVSTQNSKVYAIMEYYLFFNELIKTHYKRVNFLTYKRGSLEGVWQCTVSIFRTLPKEKDKGLGFWRRYTGLAHVFPITLLIGCFTLLI